jgi:transcriptional regulator with XRE-family HTH domain
MMVRRPTNESPTPFVPQNGNGERIGQADVEELDDRTPAIGQRLREERLRQKIGLREIAARLGVTPSLVSQIESGRARPSVMTLYALVSELNLSLDELFGTTNTAPWRSSNSVKRAHERHTIQLEDGVEWQQLGRMDGAVELVQITYRPGASGSSQRELIRHSGIEAGILVEGALRVQLGFDTYELQPGDSISFSSAVPHRLYNAGEVPARAIWMMSDTDSSI